MLYVKYGCIIEAKTQKRTARQGVIVSFSSGGWGLISVLGQWIYKTQETELRKHGATDTL